MTMMTESHILVTLDTGEKFDLGTFDTEEEAEERLHTYASAINSGGIEFIGGNGIMVSTKHIVYMGTFSNIAPLKVQNMFTEESQ